MTVISSIFSGIAALATVVAVYFAHETVQETRRNRGQEATAHREAMESEEQLLAAMRTAHEQEMEERLRAVERELLLQRLTQLGRVQELLGNVIETTGATIALRKEAGRPTTVGMGDTRVSSALLRAELGLAILAQLGGPALPEFMEAAERGRMVGTPLHDIETEAARALNAVRSLAQSDPNLRLASYAPSSSADEPHYP